MSPGVSFDVKGALISHGTADRPIEFSCDTSSAFGKQFYVGCRTSPNANTMAHYRDNVGLTIEKCIAFCRQHEHAVAYL